jgi:exodeoxyribonuclease V gamma subunit
MSPLFMEFIQGLARHTDVHFYLLNPAQAFWADIVARKSVALEEFENGHPLLASLGQQGREFQQTINNGDMVFKPKIEMRSGSCALNSLFSRALNLAMLFSHNTPRCCSVV